MIRYAAGLAKENQGLTAESAGRLKTLLRTDEERRDEWTRAENALADFDALRAVIQQEVFNDDSASNSFVRIVGAAGLWPKGEQVPVSLPPQADALPPQTRTMFTGDEVSTLLEYLTPKGEQAPTQPVDITTATMQAHARLAKAHFVKREHDHDDEGEQAPEPRPPVFHPTMPSTSGVCSHVHPQTTCPKCHPVRVAAACQPFDDGRDVRCQCEVYQTCQWCRPKGEQAPQESPAPTQPQWRCTLCGCLWRREWPDSWSLWDTNQRSCEVCDNSTEFGRVITRVVPSPAERAEQWLRLHANDYNSPASVKCAVRDFVTHNAATCAYCNPAPEPKGEAHLPAPGHTCTYAIPFTPDDKLHAAADLERAMADVPDMLRAEHATVTKVIAMVEARRWETRWERSESEWLGDVLAALREGR
ncbi:MAG: hypothetical protein NUW22_05040 [Acidobacteria bacterium]|nr:hypothetical protein [Acidobacteriota bacterium]